MTEVKSLCFEIFNKDFDKETERKVFETAKNLLISKNKKRDVEIIKMRCLEKETFKKISEIYQRTPTRIRDIHGKSIRLLRSKPCFEILNEVINPGKLKKDLSFFTSIDDLGLSVRTYNSLCNGKIKYLYELCSKSEKELLSIKNFGRISLNEVRELLSSFNLSLNMSYVTNYVKRLKINREPLENIEIFFLSEESKTGSVILSEALRLYIQNIRTVNPQFTDHQSYELKLKAREILKKVEDKIKFRQLEKIELEKKIKESSLETVLDGV